MDYLAFERRLLRLIFETNAQLTPVHVAYYLDLPIAEARSHLDMMVTSGILELDSDDEGHLVYRFPQRPPLAELKDPRPVRRRRRRRRPAEVRPGVEASRAEGATPPPVASGDMVLWQDRPYSPATAAALSFFLPGVGQIYSGRVAQGIGWLLATGLGYLLFLVPGLILHICCVVNAAAVPARVPLPDRRAA